MLSRLFVIHQSSSHRLVSLVQRSWFELNGFETASSTNNSILCLNRKLITFYPFRFVQYLLLKYGCQAAVVVRLTGASARLQ